jgi:hypothetical protein
MTKRKEYEKCPKCGSIYIQYHKEIDECYCLVKDCCHKWKTNLDLSNIKNPYLRISTL